jgi:hypothetical protein
MKVMAISVPRMLPGTQLFKKKVKRILKIADGNIQFAKL